MKEYIKKYWKVGVLCALTFILLFGVKTCYDKRIESLKIENNFYKAEKDSMIVKINERDSLINYTKVLYQGSQDQVKLLKEHNYELYLLAKDKKVQTVIKTDVKTKIDTVTDKVIVYVDSSKGGEVRESNIKDKYYNAKVTSTPKSTALTLEAWSPITVSVQKDGTLKAQTPLGSPITITDIQGFNKVEPKKKSKWWIPLAVGVVGGVVGGNYLFNR